jgi:hypothetical protein
MKSAIRTLLAGTLMAVAGGTQAAWAQATDTATADANVTVITPLTVTKNTDLNFGTVVRPQTGGLDGFGEELNFYAGIGTNGARTGNVAFLGGGATAATFAVSGEGTMAYTPTVSFALNSTSSSGVELGGFVAQCDSLGQSLSGGASLVLGGCALAAGTSAVKVGGDLIVSPASAGTYTNGAVTLGTITVVVAYN